MSLDGSVTPLMPLLEDSASLSEPRVTSWSVNKVGVITSVMGPVIAMSYLSKSNLHQVPIGIMLILTQLLVPSEAVCPHCKSSIDGCPGDDRCPAFMEWSANAAIFAQNRLGSHPKVGGPSSHWGAQFYIHSGSEVPHDSPPSCERPMFRR